ncbi:hypothetical protein [Streptomyces sp. CAU 1734]|uniref:hypothetical protein n=1 Tax=Streptomyces sp. CAU 1734 TaxID=3140360 RepID=UPI003261946E
MAVAALGLALTGCGVQPTGVIGAGEPATGLTRGVRMYYASASGLRAVPLLNVEVKNLETVVKLLHGEPPERPDDVYTLVDLPGYNVSGKGNKVTVLLADAYPQSQRDQATGQLVCTLASTQSVLDPKVRAENVEVTIRSYEGIRLDPVKCSDFMND